MFQNEKGDAKNNDFNKNGREMLYINNGSGWTQLQNYVGKNKGIHKIEKTKWRIKYRVHRQTEAPTTTEVTNINQSQHGSTTTAKCQQLLSQQQKHQQAECQLT